MTSALPKPLANLITTFSRLPGIGPKTASRLTFFLLRDGGELAEALAESLHGLKSGIVLCERCFNIAESSPCAICADPGRDPELICVVEEPMDVLAIERTGVFRGVYHVLHGALSPIDGVYPDKLRIRELLERVRQQRPREIILATNPSLEGENTAAYLHQQLLGLGCRISRLARGLPVGGDLEYTDEVTLSRALEGRQAL